MGTVLRTHATPFVPHAGFHGTQAFGVGVTAGHSDVFPDVDEVFFLHTQQVDTLTARDLHGRNFVFIDRVGNPAQFVRRGFTAPHTWHDRVGSIFLDIGVAAFVDETALWIVFGYFRPCRNQVVIDGGAAGGAAIGGFPFHELEDIGNGGEFAAANGIAHRLVAMVGTTAHGFHFGRGGIIAARCEHQKLFDQSGTRAARRTGLGVLTHFIQREQPFFFNRLADGSLGYAVAATDFGLIGHGGSLVVAFVSDIADIGFAKHQFVTHIADAAAIAQQFEIPASIHRVTVEAGSDELIVLDNEFFVDTAEWVAHHDFFVVGSAHEVTRAEQINTRYFEFGGSQTPRIACNTQLREMVGGYFGLFKQRRDQTVSDTAMRRAFTHRVDAGIGHGLHGVVDHDAAINVQLHAFCQFGIGANTHRHHHQIRCDFAAVFELDGFHTPIVTRYQRLGLRTHAEFQTPVFQRFLQHLACDFIQLALHQPRRIMNDMDIHTAQH